MLLKIYAKIKQLYVQPLNNDLPCNLYVQYLLVVSSVSIFFVNISGFLCFRCLHSSIVDEN